MHDPWTLTMIRGWPEGGVLGGGVQCEKKRGQL